MARSNIMDECKRYGYVFSKKKSILFIGLALGLTFFFGFVFSLQAIYQGILALVILLLLPFFLRNALRNRYEQQRFSDLNNYMEQFLYSFQKSGKILDALVDVRTLFTDGVMAELLDQSIHYISHTFVDNKVEAKGLLIIEDAFHYPMLHRIHAFALQVEDKGGGYDKSIQLLLESRRLSADRVYELLKRKRHHRNQVILSILTSLILCSMIYYMADSMEITFVDNNIVQIVTLLVLVLDLFILLLADCKMTGEYIEETEDLTDYEELFTRFYRYDEKKFFQRIGKQSLRKRLEHQLELSFPDWLMELSLLLQSENVQVAIAKSYEASPPVLKPWLAELISELENNPTGFEPFHHFLEDFTLPEAKSSMKMLYSLSEGRGSNPETQVDEIIRRNQKMLDQAARLKNDDVIASLYGLFLAPQLTAGAKLICDMVCFFMIYMSSLMQVNL